MKSEFFWKRCFLILKVIYFLTSLSKDNFIYFYYCIQPINFNNLHHKRMYRQLYCINLLVSLIVVLLLYGYQGESDIFLFKSLINYNIAEEGVQSKIELFLTDKSQVRILKSRKWLTRFHVLVGENFGYKSKDFWNRGKCSHLVGWCFQSAHNW